MKSKGIVSVYCDAACKFNENGRCQQQGITINADQICEDYKEVCEHPDVKNGICLVCGEEA